MIFCSIFWKLDFLPVVTFSLINKDSSDHLPHKCRCNSKGPLLFQTLSPLNYLERLRMRMNCHRPLEGEVNTELKVKQRQGGGGGRRRWRQRHGRWRWLTPESEIHDFFVFFK
jgi:hypothetical protein